MSRNNSIYKETYNRGLDFIKSSDVGTKLPTEKELSDKWGISRTTVRAVLTHLDETDIIDWTGRAKTILKKPLKSDYFLVEETLSVGQRVETQFMEYILGGDLKPGAIIRESELVREFGASTSVVREFLIRFSRFGLIEKEPNRHWVLRGFTKEFAIELFDVREMFELRAFKAFLARDADNTQHTALMAIKDEHLHVAADIDVQYLNFPRLDEKFHRVFIDGLNNRFVEDFFELVSVIFHYHYRWNKQDEKERNLHAVGQHLDIIHAIAEKDDNTALAAFKAHLRDARKTLLNSVTWEANQ